ncbi:MAG: ABC transporter ATP-binding protein [Alphaproteobacteria bacterium]|nr:ABC transporter ATP-binding protein [Alphaproteobacteria bacterium]
MSSDPAIRAVGLTKSFQVYARPEDRLKQSIWRRRRFYKEFVALSDVSFEVARGETVGIVGRNGSGKSTLLQIVAGTLTPTHGTVEVNGRVAALLELGAGFNPEFTGRENVFLNASVLGLGQAEIERRFDDIVAFAEIAPFIDQPVKTYSSGMYVRLAFAVAISVDPDVLIVDEALAVGDEAFQRKCFARIRQVQERGSTILFVSHAANAVIELCDRAILMERGAAVLIDTPKAVIAAYHRLLYDKAADPARLIADIRARQPSDSADTSTAAQPVEGERFDPDMVSKSRMEYDRQGAEILEPRVTTLAGEPVNVLMRGRDYVYTFRVRFDRKREKVRCGMFIRTVIGHDLGGSGTAGPWDGLDSVEPGQVVTARFVFTCLLLPGSYFLNAGAAAVIDGQRVFVHRIVDAVMFRVAAETGLLIDGVVDFRIRSELTRD